MANVENIVTGMAGRYASALFSLAQDSHSADQIAADLNNFMQLVQDNPDLQRLVKSPVFSAEEQVRALGAIVERAGFLPVTSNFLKLVASKRRLFAVESMVKDFNALNDAAKGVTRARVTVASRLSDEQWNELQNTLNDISGKQVAMSVFVDPEIIGGLVVRLGSRMIDGSLRTKLNSIRTRMKEVG